MIQSRREYLRQQRLRRRRIFYISCLAFFIIVAILIGILISRISGNNDSAPVSDTLAESSSAQDPEAVSPEAGSSEDGSHAGSIAEGIDSSSGISLAGSGDWLEQIHLIVREEAIENSIPVIVPPSGYELRFMTQEDIHKGNLILINKNYAYEFLDFADNSELISMYDIMSGTYDVSGTDVLMQAVAAESLNQMLSDFYDNTWMEDLIILCGYRTMEESQQLYDASAAENGQDHADRYVMKPGFSEHHSALATDIGIMNWDGTITYQFGEDPYDWITKNCHKYGFIVRYPEEKAAITEIDYESWHFRYVGVPNATAMVNEGLCMEEYIDFIKNYTADGLHYQVSTADGTYDIYYAEGIQIPVPQMQSYEISGNNVDGFIVTVKVS